MSKRKDLPAIRRIHRILRRVQDRRWNQMRRSYTLPVWLTNHPFQYYCGVSSYNGISSKITFNSYTFDQLPSCKTFMNNYLKPKAGVSRRADFESKGEVQAAACACTCGDLVGSLLRMIPALDTSTLPADANQRSLCTLLMQVAVDQLKSATCTKATSFALGFPFVGSLVGK